MALQTKTYSTGSFTYEGSSRGYILDLILTEESTDVLANTSLVSYKLQLRSGPSNRFNWEFTSTISLNGTQVATKTEEKYLDYNSTWILLSGQATIAHNSDGKLDMAYSATVTPYNGGTQYTPPKLTLSGTMTLTAIARASTLAATAAFIEDASTIAVSRKSTNYTHSIRYQFGSLSGYLADAAGALSDTEQKLTATTIVFPIPERFYAQIPDDPSGVCTLTCTTYSGSTKIGNSQTATFRITADPARCGPTVGGVVADVNEATLALSGDSSILVAGQSVAQCTVTAQARKSASISALYLNGTEIENATHAIMGVNTASITFRVVDSRGYPAEYTVPGLTLIPYIPLSFNVSATRTDPTSGNATLSAQGKWYKGSFGATDNALTAAYRLANGEWTQTAAEISDGDLTVSVDLTGLDYQQSHTLELQLSDALQTVTKSVTVSKGIPVFDWGENDFRFHVPVILTATDGTAFTIDLIDGKLTAQII